MKELKDYHDNGIKPEEMTFMKNSIGLREALRYETAGQKHFSFAAF
jgi:zinc protease